MSKKLEGKVAVVTGASKGIGAGIARALADEGASVVVNYSSSKQGANRVVAEISGRGGKAIAVQGDVSKQADIERLFSEAPGARGRQRHQHRVGRELAAASELHGVHGDQGRSRRDHGRAGKRAWPAEDSGELDQPGDDRDGRGTFRGLYRQRLPEDGRDAGAARTHGATGRYRADSRISGVFGLQVHDR